VKNRNRYNLTTTVFREAPERSFQPALWQKGVYANLAGRDQFPWGGKTANRTIKNLIINFGDQASGHHLLRGGGDI